MKLVKSDGGGCWSKWRRLPEQVVESLEDVFILRRLAYHQGSGDMGSYMNFISGPSRSGDIEQTIVTGVHGPVEAHMVILEGS